MGFARQSANAGSGGEERFHSLAAEYRSLRQLYYTSLQLLQRVADELARRNYSIPLTNAATMILDAKELLDQLESRLTEVRDVLANDGLQGMDYVEELLNAPLSPPQARTAVDHLLFIAPAVASKPVRPRDCTAHLDKVFGTLAEGLRRPVVPDKYPRKMRD